MGSHATWRFIERVESRRQSWCWQRLASDGGVLFASPEFANYAKAVVDAVQNGFKPAEMPYVVETMGLGVHFAPGQKPVYVGAGLEPQRSAVRRTRRRRKIRAAPESLQRVTRPTDADVQAGLTPPPYHREL